MADDDVGTLVAQCGRSYAGLMVTVDAAVWKRWKKQEDRGDASAIALALRSSLDPQAAMEAVGRAFGVALDRFAERYPDVEGEDEAYPGYWLANRSGDIAIVQVSEHPDHFPWTLEQIAAALSNAGVEGRFELPPWPAKPSFDVSTPHLRFDLLECRIRANGTGHPSQRGPRPVWIPDRDAVMKGASQAVDWALRDDDQPIAASVSASTLRTPLAEFDDPRELMLDAVRRCSGTISQAQLHLFWPDRFRLISVHPHTGRVSLAEGGEALSGEGWREPLATLRGQLESATGWAVYGFVKRGRKPVDATMGWSLADDWPQIPHFLAAANQEDAFEHRLVPDAFGIQLLGAGYDGWTPAGEEWCATRLPGGACLVEHADAAAWFAQPLPYSDPPPGELPDPDAPIPPLLIQPRAQFAPVMLTAEVAQPPWPPAASS